MGSQISILLQTTIPAIPDDWNIDRFSLLRDHLASLVDESGEPLCKVTARNREVNADGNDAVLSGLDTTDFDELWLFAVDTAMASRSRTVRGLLVFASEVAAFSPLAIIRISDLALYFGWSRPNSFFSFSTS